MKVLITGKGTSGSFAIRGQQLGAAIGATVKPNATLADMRAHDVVVLVKRPTDQLLRDMHASGARLIHDLVDAWPQPAGNSWDEKTAKEWLTTIVDHVNADGIICATKAMERDVEHAVKCTVYHHANPAYKPRQSACYWHNVAYEGATHYLGRHADVIKQECHRRGWMFTTGGIQSGSIVLAVRDCTGYAPRFYKSNVKCANAQALGLPLIASPESGYQETSTGGVLWIESPDQLRQAFDALADPVHYAKVCAAVDPPPTLAQCARQYLAFLERVVNA